MKSRIILLTVCLCLAPLLVRAQQQAFQTDLQLLTRQFHSQDDVTITQKYTFSFDSATGPIVDSITCSMRKHMNEIWGAFHGVESFSDGTFMIRADSLNKRIWLAHKIAGDPALFDAMLTQGLGNFKSFQRVEVSATIASWRLRGGSEDVRAVDVDFDIRNRIITTVHSELAPGHPFARQLAGHNGGRLRSVFVQISYTYNTRPPAQWPRIADYVHVDSTGATPAPGYAGYQIRLIK